MNKPIMIMMMGVAKSGKTTRAKQLAEELGAEIFSPDEIAKELYRSAPTSMSKAHSVMERRLLDALRAGRNVIYDDENLHSKFRAHFVRRVRATCDAQCRCEIVTADLVQSCQRSKAKDDDGFEAHIYKGAFKQFQVPVPAEGWDEVTIYHSTAYNISKILDEYNDMPQYNPHHSLTLGEHMFTTWQNLPFNCEPEAEMAAMLHDIGKPYCITFRNAHGKVDGMAHYYGHDILGAYLVLSHTFWDKSPEYCLRVAQYIQYHMLPYTAPSEDDVDEWTIKMLKKKGFDDTFIFNLLGIHHADKAAR